MDHTIEPGFSLMQWTQYLQVNVAEQHKCLLVETSEALTCTQASIKIQNYF